MRNGKEKQVQASLERTKLTAAEVRRDINEDFGLTVRELTFFDRDGNRWPIETKGVLIDKVERGGWAQLGNLRQRDLVLKINDQTIENLKQYGEIMDMITQNKNARVTFLILRGVETHFQYIEPDWVPQVSGQSLDKQ